MISRVLITEPHITIAYDVAQDLLYADWTGNQTKESVMDGCEKMLACLKQHQCHKVLNDNTNVTSIWDDAAEWVALDWVPRMHAAGCQVFALVYSPNVYSRLSADKAYNYGIKGIIVSLFHRIETATAWLQAL